jgi:RHH-type transcriptional regulator, proline utilization regulon repressor / proline dehydrogenase / delta 1-pyrroline-5-carboxylate dehydrogenase
VQSLGNFIGGQFVAPAGTALVSRNPAADGAVVFETGYTVEAVDHAAAAAATAQPAWAALSTADRWAHLERFRAAIAAKSDQLADAIVIETGKIRSEAKAEIQTLINRFELVKNAMAADLKPGSVGPGETLRYQALGVVGVIGPFNFPLHLCHAHVIPALAAGNTVVVKPSDITPLCGQRYAECAAAAELPAGVVNVIAGTGDVGAAMIAAKQLHGLCFTGSWAVGQKILEAATHRPELLIALEMGGKNACVVLDDAAMRQAVHEVTVSGYLSAGQRCTGSERVLVHRKIADRFIDALAKVVRSLKVGNPEDASSFAGPLATAAALAKVEKALAAAKAGGAEPIVAGEKLAGGSYRTPSLHRLRDGVHDVAGYTDIEIFGPDLCVEVIDSDEEALAILNASPYGFVHAVFTASRFEPFYQRTKTGMLNRNRSTNLASAKLPFGGVGKSGNYRPAGAWAHRNVVHPVAILENPLGAVTPHAMLAAHLPGYDLDRLESQHAREEAEEATRSLIDMPRPMQMLRPAGGRLPKSETLLARLYAGDRVPKEKKPPVFDHLRSSGPWMVSIDDEPLCVLDGMSQTATVVGGFAEDPVVAAYTEGEFAELIVANDDTALGETWAATDYANTLRQLVPGLPHVTFVSSGSESNEKAMALCRINCERPNATKILAFDGSFHGRTLLSVHATHSPSKRLPFELAGYHATFAPYPLWNSPNGDEPSAPSGYYAAAATGDTAELVERFGDPKNDPLLAAEVASLAAVHAALSTGEYFCTMIEPMQSEGGDRYATERFFRALRLLTRHHKTFLVFDEVQVGFGLGGPFAWHSKFRLMSSRGQQDYPDAVTFAKRAQVGVVMSRFADPEPTSAHGASLVRGRIHADMVSTSHNAERLEKLVWPRLTAIAKAYPHLVQHPRATGYAFAFELPTTQLLDAYLGQRFWRGAIVFAAGTKTARYRLSDSFHAREIDQLFETIRRSLSWLDAHEGKKPPEWEDLPVPASTHVPRPELRYRQIAHGETLEYLPAILDIEYQVYEPARRTPPAEIKAAIEDRDGSLIVSEAPGASGAWTLVGFAIGGPLEQSKDVEGCDDDPMLGKHNSMYSVSITVAPTYQSAGIGRKLKALQLQDSAARKKPDGTPRYRYVTGRNRVGRTAEMTHLNRVYGAHVVQVMTGQYEDPEGQAIYYRIPLGAFEPDPVAQEEAIARRAAQQASIDGNDPDLDLASGMTKPFANGPASLVEAERRGLLYGPAVNKLTLMNYVTPGAVRALEWLGSLVPELPHLYLTSSRDEAFDKALRLIRCTRKQASIAIGLEGGYYGHTVASARSLSDPAVHHGGPAHFNWPRVPHPARAGTAETIRALRTAVEAAGKANVLGFFYEPVQERTGWVLPPDFVEALSKLRTELDLPLIALENTTHTYRSGKGAFVSPALGLIPDVLAWWGGGQTGYLHTSPRWFISAPLTLVSTWDGDELSLVRQHHQLRAARHLDIAGPSALLDRALAKVGSSGLGAYRVIDAGERAGALAQQLGQHGIRVRRFPQGRLGIIPPLDQLEATVRALESAL